MEVWHPRAVQVLPDTRYGAADSGAMVDGYPWRQVAHTTEGGPIYYPTGHDYYGHWYWPHATIARVNRVARICQHIPIDRGAFALEHPSGHAETNKAFAVQAEIGWYASQIDQLPDDIAACYVDWVTWVADETGAPLTGPLPNTGHRFTEDEWRGFTGVCGHVHVPEQSHVDPGHLDLTALIAKFHQQPQPAPTEEESMLIEVPWATGFPRAAWKVTDGPVLNSFNIVSFNGAPLDHIGILGIDGKVHDGGPFKEGFKDANGRVTDTVAFGLWVRTQYDTVGGPQGFIRLDSSTVAVMTGPGSQYVIGRK